MVGFTASDPEPFPDFTGSGGGSGGGNLITGNNANGTNNNELLILSLSEGDVIEFTYNTLELTSYEEQWLSNHPDKEQAIVAFLKSKLYSDAAIEFANDAVNTWIQGKSFDLNDKGAFAVYELEDLLEQDPQTLIDLPCSELQKYQDLATHQLPNSVVERLQELSAQDATFLDELSGFENWHIQDLNNANGTVVNMDYFPVTISKLPDGFTAASLLEHIRKNINDFTNNDAEFQSYPGLSGEDLRWNSSNPLGSIISINLFPHDGSVIVTESTSHSWIFSVIRTPLDVHHPISGNREFGFTQNLNGSYTFYTRGVDRLTQPNVADLADVVSGFGGDLMAEADDLWQSFQDEIKEFVDQNGGVATLPTERNQGDRPNWGEVEQFLNGDITLNELRNDCQE